MAHTMKRLCTICARGGSKGVPDKNIAVVAGRPLIAHSVSHARDAGLFACVAVSSDSDEILRLAGEAGADLLVKRPGELASDTASKVLAIRHCALAAEGGCGDHYDTVVDLDVTSPLRLPSDIVGVVALLETTGGSNVITGAPSHRSPYFNLVERTPEGFVRLSKPALTIVRRQDAPPCFDMNASIYGWRRDVLIENPGVFYSDTRLFEMPLERSLDIDTPLDMEIVAFLMERGVKGRRVS